MSYNIIYNPENKKRYPPVRNKKSNPFYIVLILLLGSVAVYGLTQSGIIHYLIPGDPEITAEAFSVMVERVGQGETVGTAFASFCKEIIYSCY